MEKIEIQIAEISSAELATLRAWLAEFDASPWDRQFEADVKAGKLDGVTEHALSDHAAGRSCKL